MYDILTSNAQSVLSQEGVQTENAGVVKFTSANEGCVEFIDNSKTYRLHFIKNGNEFDLSDEVETIINNKSMTEADENDDATSSNETEEGTEEVVEETKIETTELEESKAINESKLADIETKIASMMSDIEELKACMPNKKTEEVTLISGETETEENSTDDSNEESLEETSEELESDDTIKNNKRYETLKKIAYGY